MNKRKKEKIIKVDIENPIIISLSVLEKILYAIGEKFVSMGYKYLSEGMLKFGTNIEYHIAANYIPNDYCVAYIIDKNVLMIFGVYKNT